MAAVKILTNFYLCGVNSDRDVNWLDGTICVVKDATVIGKFYQLNAGVFNFLYNTNDAPVYDIRVNLSIAAVGALRNANDYTDSQVNDMILYSEVDYNRLLIKKIITALYQTGIPINDQSLLNEI